jgi:hypothetical protein
VDIGTPFFLLLHSLGLGIGVFREQHLQITRGHRQAHALRCYMPSSSSQETERTTSLHDTE